MSESEANDLQVDDHLGGSGAGSSAVGGGRAGREQDEEMGGKLELWLELDEVKSRWHNVKPLPVDISRGFERDPALP